MHRRDTLIPQRIGYLLQRLARIVEWRGTGGRQRDNPRHAEEGQA